MSFPSKSNSNSHSMAAQLVAALVAAKAITPEQVEASKQEFRTPPAPTPIQPPKPASSTASPTAVSAAPPAPAPAPTAENPSPESKDAVNTQQQTAPENQNPPAGPQQNPTVQACMAAWRRVWDDPELKRLSMMDHRRRAQAAFCDVMPSLVGRQNVQEFIGCVAKGMLIGAIDLKEGPKLLYAAQVAHSACEPLLPPRPSGRPRTQSSNDETPPPG